MCVVCVCVCVCVCVVVVGWVMGVAVQNHFVIINNKKKIQSEVRSAKLDNKAPSRALRFS